VEVVHKCILLHVKDENEVAGGERGGGGVLTKDRGGDEEHANAVLTSLIPCIQRRCIYNADNNEKCFSDEERVRFEIILTRTVKPYTLGGDEEHANAVLTSLIPCIQRRCIYNADNNEKCFSDEEE
jgi:hypothetical protein